MCCDGDAELDGGSTLPFSSFGRLPFSGEPPPQFPLTTGSRFHRAGAISPAATILGPCSAHGGRFFFLL